MTQKTKSERFKIFLQRLQLAESADSREGALALLKQIMNEVEDGYSGYPMSEWDRRMHVYGWDHGWENLDTDPCYWDDRISNKHRTWIFNDGRIVIESLHEQRILIDKQGFSQSSSLLQLPESNEQLPQSKLLESVSQS